MSRRKRGPTGVQRAPSSTYPRTAVAAVLLFLGVFLAYVNTWSAPFVFDDRAAILDNPTIRSLWPLPGPLAPPAGGSTVSGRPLVNLSLALNYKMSGLDPWSYRAANMLIHALAGLALFGVVRRTRVQLTRVEPPAATAGSESGDTSVFVLALAVALLWALHPLQTAAVSSAVQRAEALAGLFLLATLYLFIRGAESVQPWRWFAAAVATCLAGMASKEVMIVAPLVVLLYDRTFLAGSFAASWRQRRAVHLMLAACSGLALVIFVFSGQRGGTVGLEAGISPWRYLLTQAEAVVLYLKLVVWPHPLVFDHGTALAPGLMAVLPQAVLVAGMLTLTAVLVWKRPRAGFCPALFFLLLAPTSSLVPVVSQTVAEHRMYLPLAAVLCGIAFAARTRWTNRASLVILALVPVAGIATAVRNLDYRSEVSLWASTVAARPENPRAHLNLGSALLEAGRPDEAAAAYRQAIVLRPDEAAFYAALSHACAQLDQLDEAVAAGRNAVRLDARSVEARLHLAGALLRSGQADAAIVEARVARGIQPEATDVRLMLAGALVQRSRDFARQGSWASARRDAAEATEIAPDLVEGFFALGNVLAATEDMPGAISAYRRALAVDPAHRATRNNLANALLVAGQLAEAIVEYERVLQDQPNDASVRANLEEARALQRERPGQPP